MDYLCPLCGELLAYNRDYGCWWCSGCHWFTRMEATLERIENLEGKVTLD